jgi:hypothetical protein
MYLDFFKSKFIEYNLKISIEPCTGQEISSLEQKLGFILPIAYK